MLDELRDILLGIPEVRDYTNGNVYTHYLDENSIFPCITLVLIVASDIESVSFQVKIWTLMTANPKKELIAIYEVIKETFESRNQKSIESKAVFEGLRNDATINPNILFDKKVSGDLPLVEETSEPVDEIVLTEKFNDIEVFSLPIILASKDILPIQSQPEKVVETQPELVGRTEVGVNTTGEAI